jgi:hypothetical protein
MLAVMLTAVLAYVVFSRETEPGGVLLIAAWPIAILVWSLINVRASNEDVVTIIRRLAAGGAVPLLPLLLYHIAHGSVAAWISDIVLVSGRVTSMPFFGRGWYGALPIAALYQVISSLDPIKTANGLYWVALSALSALNGLIVLWRLQRSDWTNDLVPSVIASFYALVSLYLEGPLYLYYSVGLTLVSLLWLAAARSAAWRVATGATSLALAVVATAFHAGQPPERTPKEILAGTRLPTVSSGLGLSRCTLRLSDDDRRTFARLVALIQSETTPDEYILAIPNDAEFYFLAERRNPVRFYNSALGMQTEDDWRKVISRLDERPPRLVVFRTDDKWNTEASLAIMARVRARYHRIATLAGRDIYRLP